MKRGPGPRRDPAKIRAWQDRSRQAGTFGKVRVALSPGTRRVRPALPARVRAEAFARTRGRCVRCGGHATEAHHVLPVQSFPEFTLESRVIVPCCPSCHDEHERHRRPLRLSELPAVVRAFVLAAGPAAEAHLGRRYEP